MKGRLSIGTIVTLGVLMASTSATAKDTYRVVLERQYAVGDRFRSECSFKDTVSADGKPRVTTLEVTGVVKVLAVDDKKGIQSAEVTIESGTASRLGKSEVIKAGTVFLVAADKGKSRVLDPKKNLSKLVGGALDMSKCFRARTGKHRMKHLYQSKGPVAVGQSWAIDSAKAAEELAKRGMQIAPTALSGKATLVAANRNRGAKAPILQLTAEFDATGVVLKKDGTTTRDGKMSARFTGSLPSGAMGPALRMTEKVTMTMTLTVTEADGKKVDHKMSFERTRSGRNTLLK